MGKNYFTEEQVAELNLNSNVQKVSTKAITYTEAFRQWFYQEYQDGKMPSIIFQEAGFDTNVLGKQRIQNFSKRTKNMAQR
ncbi:IS3 family transposase, partial [Tetragenococcus koreensis]|uniref:HTH domain-containing protein n=1 Tax=Tetragenococcus koreensis TaxID=290335 RepID=UPI002A09CD5B|nr:IS3 family transposase [Tetragenococcus koreensis]MCF1613661.1 IS3 family transposase [Tetragenococcus koreensis]MCF1619016.1 IS3 family transposase [Tetragenococcus koreensis]MCF1623439.1 IS3 family transposase [Tetragenococcus koreensis]MCF1628444.1 IS3 family transposase [Tetragenococcus koreensis]